MREAVQHCQWLLATLYYWLFAILLTINEVILTYGNIALGVFLHLSLFAGILLCSHLSNKEGGYRVYLPLTLAPLLRIISFTLPLAGIPQIIWYVIVSIPLFATAIMVADLLGLTYFNLGYTTERLGRQLLIALIGVPLGLIVYYVIKPSPIDLVTENIWLSVLILFVCTGILEEFIFRGILYKTVSSVLGTSNAALFVSCIFAALQIPQQSFLSVGFAFLTGLVFASIVRLQGSIIGVSLAHGLINITVYIIGPLFLP